MNKLFNLKKMGFKISWNLIAMGVYGNDEIPPTITHIDVIDYLDSLLIDINEQTDNIISLVCEKDDCVKFNRLLKKLANEDSANIAVQKRKWRACLLKNLIDNISKDYLQGLLELLTFWTSMGMPNDCPQKIPSKNDEKEIQEYFTKESYKLILDENRMWLNYEIKNIIELDN